MKMDSNDIINQITLNCLISKSQLMRINNTKIKKNLNVERNKKIKKYKSQLIELFENLLNKNELFDDDVQHSYTQFIDKCIIHLDKQCENTNSINNEYENVKNEYENVKNEDTNDQNIKNDQNVKNEDELNKKIYNMMNECYNERYHEMVIGECEENLEEKCCEDDENENDEDDEY